MAGGESASATGGEAPLVASGGAGFGVLGGTLGAGGGGVAGDCGAASGVCENSDGCAARPCDGTTQMTANEIAAGKAPSRTRYQCREIDAASRQNA